jgi:hypothetical protein
VVVVVAFGRRKRALCGASPPASSPLRVLIRPAPPRIDRSALIITVVNGLRPEGASRIRSKRLHPGPLRLPRPGYRRQAKGLPQMARASHSLHSHLEGASQTPKDGAHITCQALVHVRFSIGRVPFHNPQLLVTTVFAYFIRLLTSEVTMTSREAITQDEPKHNIQNAKLTVIATLLASFIGGAFGFGGSLLVYFSSAASIAQASNQHMDDVRRETYASFIADSSKLRSLLQFASKRAIAAGHTLSGEDCNFIDLFATEEADLVRVYLISPANDASDFSYKINTSLHDWHNSLCAPGSSYTQGTRDSARNSVDYALAGFRKAATRTLAK